MALRLVRTPVTEAQVDNININGNAITSTNTNGNITITPNGTGDVVIDGLNYRKLMAAQVSSSRQMVQGNCLCHCCQRPCRRYESAAWWRFAKQWQ